MEKPTFEIEEVKFESEKWKDEFVEKGANLEHIRWAKWQYYLHTCLIWNDTIKNWELTNEQKERWDRQIRTPYDQLSESEKESGRKESRVYLPLVDKILKQQKKDFIESEIKYWKDIFDNRPKDRDLESDNIAQNFARIEIERLENKLITL